jgi:UTP-glucose-1-phosphate uridylyltransferase
LIQLAVEEAIRAGIKEIAFVTSSTKPIIEAHFIPCLLWNRFLLKEEIKLQLILFAIHCDAV